MLPNGAHWANDVYSLAKPVIDVLSAQGAKTWYFLGADYAFGHASVEEGIKFVVANGGRSVGTAFHPFNTMDFASYLLQAQAAKPQVLFLANSGGDATNSIKQANEFDLTSSGVKVAAVSLDISDVHAIGLQAARGTYLTLPFYWNDDDAGRAFAKRFMEKAHVTMPPTQGQAAVYSAVLHYLRAVKAAGTTDAKPVMAKMRELPVEDFMTHGARLRRDGRLLRDNGLYVVKNPSESKSEWDVLTLVERIPGERAFRPDDGSCVITEQ